MEHVIRNASYFLGRRGWQLQLVHSGTAASHSYLCDLFRPEELACIQLVPLGVDNLTRRAYSELLCSHWLWEQVAAETVLVFQTDSLICRDGIDDLATAAAATGASLEGGGSLEGGAHGRYDYCGAPFRLDQTWSRGVPWLAAAGNGGFSLRSRAMALRMLDWVDYSRGEPEDVWFVEHTPRVGGRLASREAAARFAIEAVVTTDPPAPLGMHAPYKYVDAETMASLLAQVSYEEAPKDGRRAGAPMVDVG